MHVVVTGATGNVGSALLRLLSAARDIGSIQAVVRRPAWDWEIDKVAWTSADVGVDDLAAAFEGADALVHLAWAIQPSHDRAKTLRTNVQGSRHVFDAALSAGASTIVYASSVGTYAPGAGLTVDESWPATGVRSSFYSRDKASVERALDTLEADHPATRFVRVRPALIFRATAGAEIRRLFIGTSIPTSLLRWLPLIPALRGLRLQCVSSDDVASAIHAALREQVSGAFNLAAEPTLSMDDVAEAFEARAIPTPLPLVRTAIDLSWRAHLQPTPAGWLDMALSVPTMEVSRATDLLGWKPQTDAMTALREVIRGIKNDIPDVTPALKNAPQ